MRVYIVHKYGSIVSRLLMDFYLVFFYKPNLIKIPWISRNIAENKKSTYRVLEKKISKEHY